MKLHRVLMGCAAMCLAALASPQAIAQSADCPCGPMDIVFVIDDTGSMGGAIDEVKAGAADIVNQALANTGNDARFALVSFKDCVTVDQSFTSNTATIINAINALSADGGNNGPEASDEALNLVINNTTACACPSGGVGAFRVGAIKIVILITDNVPGGCDDNFTAGVDDVAAAQRANDAAAAGVLLSAIYVPGNGAAIPIMQNYASTSGGQYTQTALNGAGTCTAILDIISNCGGTLIDCNNNGLGDECDIATGFSQDCNFNGIPDECELAGNDCNNNGVPDECDPDCNNNGIPDDCDIANGTSDDCNNNGIPDECNDIPVNSTCDTAIPVAINSSTNGSNINACDDAAPCHLFFDTNGVWYSVTGDGSRLAADTCTFANFDTQISVFTGSCGALSCVASNDDGLGSCGLKSYVEFCTVPGQTYYIFVNGFANQEGNFTLDVYDVGSGYDCNCNGIDDECDLEFDPSLDSNNDGYIDACTACAGDTNCDGVVDGLDVANVFYNFGQPGPFADVNQDGWVNILDYYIVAWNYGSVCNW